MQAMDWLRPRSEGVFHLRSAIDDMAQRRGGTQCAFECFGANVANGGAAVRLLAAGAFEKTRAARSIMPAE